MLVAYDGTDYSGWQRLGHTQHTVQQVLEDCLSSIFNEHITVIGSGRTDAGVHAQGQQAHFDALPDPKRVGQLKHALRRMLPPSVILKGLWLAPPEFHAIWSVERKTYIYRLETRPTPNIFTYRYSTWLHFPLDLELLQQHTKYLVGYQDFKSFMTSGSPVKTTLREVYSAEWNEPKKDCFTLTISGSGFLKQMVRNIVGTLVMLNKGSAPPEKTKEILEAKDRQKALWTAPARGLTLSKVFYPRELDIQCRKI